MSADLTVGLIALGPIIALLVFSFFVLPACKQKEKARRDAEWMANTERWNGQGARP